MDAAESSSGQYEYTLKDLAPNTKYQYAITSGYYTSQEESVESEIIAGTTLANDKSRPNINGPDNATDQMNDSATFEVLASVLLSTAARDTSGSSVCRAKSGAILQGQLRTAIL